MTNNRQSIRLHHYDYSLPGYYFVTICTHNMIPWFGNIVDGQMMLNEVGEVVKQEWEKTKMIRYNVKLDEFIVMPNHVHGIIIIKKRYWDHTVRRGVLQYAPTQPGCCSPSQTLGAIVRGFKSVTTKRINLLGNTPGQKVWQRNYYDHIIRNEQSLQQIREYIINNPRKWELDEYYR